MLVQPNQLQHTIEMDHEEPLFSQTVKLDTPGHLRLDGLADLAVHRPRAPLRLSEALRRRRRRARGVGTRGVDAIILTPISPTAVIPVLKKAEAQDIKIVLLASTIRSDDYDALVTVDDVDFGKAGAEWLADKLDGKGRIIALNGISGISASDDRWKGAKAVFDEYPDIEVISVVDAGWDYAKAKVAVSNLLAANPEIDGVWSQGGSMTLGAIDAFEAAQRPLVPMTGEDNNGYLKRWTALEADGFESVAPSKPTWLGSEALLVALDLLQGEEVEKNKLYEVPMITSENLSEFTRDDLSDSFWANTRLSDEQVRATFQD